MAPLELAQMEVGSGALSPSIEGGKWNFSIPKRRRLILNARFEVSGMKGLKEFGLRRALRMTRNPSYSRVKRLLVEDDCDLKVKPASGFNSITASETFSTAAIQDGKVEEAVDG